MRMNHSILACALLLSCSVAQGNWIENVGKTVSGHLSDIKSRYADDEFIQGEIVSQGAFNEEAEGQDTLHNGKGHVMIERANDQFYVQLNEDFYSSPGPDYHIYVSTSKDINTESDFTESQQIELGRLQKGSGASFYAIPQKIKVNEIKSVTIWCKQFSQYIASANITAP